MSLAPLLGAPPVIQLHVGAALAALLLGLMQFARPKGGAAHQAIGFAWLGSMALVAGSSFWITGVGGHGKWSWIHALSAGTLLMLPFAWLAARRGRIWTHRWSMIGLFLGALLVTGAFTLLPGRIMGAVVFGW